MTDRQKLLRRVQICDFALMDVILYLDGHPNCRKALEYYEKYKGLREIAMKEYTSRFGPLTAMDNTNMEHWTWIDEPFPWELEAEV